MENCNFNLMNFNICSIIMHYDLKKNQILYWPAYPSPNLKIQIKVNSVEKISEKLNELQVKIYLF